MIFKIGKRYTVYRISSMMGITTRMEITVKEIRKDPEGREGWDKVIYQPRGKRKLYALASAERRYQEGPVDFFDGAVFEGWDQPFKIDSDLNTFSGNACYNFVGTAEDIRAWIESKQLNPAFRKGIVIAVQPASATGSPDNQGSLVYPEIDTGHAVIERLKGASV